MIHSSDHDADRLLRIYLRDHFAGSTAGLALARRCRNNNPDLDQLLGGIEQEIGEERRLLQSIMSRLGAQPSRVKSALGKVAELVGRLKSNGRLVRYSPSSRVVELEGLAAGIVTKRNMWRSLAAVTESHPALDHAELDRLIEQATAQIERVVAEHDRAAAAAFSPAAAPAEHRP